MAPSQESFKKILKIIALFLGAIIVFNIIKQGVMGYFLSHYQPPPVSVSTAQVIEKPWQSYLTSVGNFVAFNGVDISPQTSGKINEILFESGQYVEANTPLIHLDDGIEQATLKNNLAELALKEINYKRMKELYAKRATSTSSLDEANASLEQARANVEKIQAQIRQKHPVTPFTGQLGIRQVNLGQYVMEGQTKIVTLQSIDPLYINFYLPEQNFKQIYLDQPIFIQLQDYPNFQFVSRITAINSIADINTHNIQVQATIPNCPQEALTQLATFSWIKQSTDPHTSITSLECVTNDNQQHHIHHFAFLPGMFTSIQIVLPQIPKALVVPDTAISYSLYGDAVYVLEPILNEKNVYQVKRRFVKTGEKNGNEVRILSGLQVGQTIVSSGELKLQNDTRVVVNNSIALHQVPNLKHLSQ